LKAFGGICSEAAQALGLTEAQLRYEVDKDPRLCAMFKVNVGEGVTPDEVEILTRQSSFAKSTENKDLAHAINKQNLQLMADGLAKAGIKEDTLKKIKSLGDFDMHAGQFLAGSLDMSHRMVVYTSVSLMEEAEHIKKTYLGDSGLPPKVKLEWQKAYNQIVDLLGKSYDRVLTGTQAMIKMTTPSGEGRRKNAKPAFQPLTEKKTHGRS